MKKMSICWPMVPPLGTVCKKNPGITPMKCGHLRSTFLPRCQYYECFYPKQEHILSAGPTVYRTVQYSIVQYSTFYVKLDTGHYQVLNIGYTTTKAPSHHNCNPHMPPLQPPHTTTQAPPS